MNIERDNIEYVLIDGKNEISTVRTNLMNEHGYTPYCGEAWSRRCSMPRTKFINDQFQCPHCGWRSEFPIEFIDRYKRKWNIK